MKTRFLSIGLLIVMTTTAMPQALPDDVIERAKSLELDTPYVPPPGDPLAHHAAGYVKVMCSAVFISGLSPEFAAENVGFFTAPYEVRGMFRKPVIDRRNKAVHVTLPNGLTRTAKYLGSQGCVTLQIGKSDVNFTPVVVKSRLPDPATQPWPMGDMLPKDPLPAEIDSRQTQRCRRGRFPPKRRIDGGICGDLEGPPHRRALWRRLGRTDSARKLVDGQEPNRHVIRHPREGRRV